jgi:hypothetical protein
MLISAPLFKEIYYVASEIKNTEERVGTIFPIMRSLFELRENNT